MTERRRGINGDGFYTPAEAARILHVPLRRVLEWLAAGEIEAERDPLSGRWMIPQSSLKGSDPARQTQEEMAWLYEKERLLAELHEWKARAEHERERAERLQGELEGLRKELEVDRLMQGRGGGTSEA